MSSSNTSETNLIVASPSDPFNVEFWRNIWTENRIYWHNSTAHPSLTEYISLITGTGQKNRSTKPLSNHEQFERNSDKIWFVPLCGKTMDISYLLSQGFRVFAVEAVKLAIETMSQEQSLNLEYDEETKLFIGANGRLKIYCGDFFTCPLEHFGPVDYVWDRGSFVAVEYPFREKYIETMQKILKNADGSWCDFMYLLETVVYDKSKYGGPPRSVDDDDIENLFRSWSNVKLLTSEEMSDEWMCRLFHVTPSRY